MRNRRSYTVEKRIEVLDALRFSSQRNVVTQFNVPRRNLRAWKAREKELRDNCGSNKTRSLTEGGREIIPFAHRIISFMKDLGRQEKVSPAMLPHTLVLLS